MAEWLGWEHQGHGINRHDLEVIDSNPNQSEIQVHSPFCLSRTWTRKFSCLELAASAYTVMGNLWVAETACILIRRVRCILLREMRVFKYGFLFQGRKWCTDARP